MSKHTRMGEDYCPTCGKLCDSATSTIGDHVPDPGDVTVCLYCGSINKYGNDMALEKMTKIEIELLPKELLTQLGTIQRLVFERNIEKMMKP